jgi:hypothetical protein
MTRERLSLALQTVPSTEWVEFERFASSFLVGEFPGIRTMAKPSGDRGRDAEIVDLSTDGNIKLQYSVTTSWGTKIKATCSRLSEFKPKPTHLIYVTNQPIGPDADELKASMFRDFGMFVDVRDQSWFLDRQFSTTSAAQASEDLARKYVDPLLSTAKLAASVAPALSENEEKIAFLHLAIDSNDRDNGRNLTKFAFESLVLGALHGSSADAPIPVHTVKDSISRIVGQGAPGQVAAQIDSAIERLASKNGRVKHIRHSGLLHTSHQENLRTKAATEVFLQQEAAFENDILASVYDVAPEVVEDEALRIRAVSDLRKVIEELLLDNGEKFTSAIDPNISLKPPRRDIEEFLTNSKFGSVIPNSAAAEAIATTLAYGSDLGVRHVRRILESYTVMALLRSTPDVQGALKKVFSGGEIWLDTSFVLPAISDSMGKKNTSFRDLVEACHICDIKLFVTTGVIEEIDSHLYSCVSTARGTSRLPKLPFLLREYVECGNSINGFPQWQEEIRGNDLPLQDIEEYLSDELGIKKRDLSSEVAAAPADLRDEVREFWVKKQEARRANSGADSFNVDLLAAHDIENTLGVIQLRTQSSSTAVGPSGYYHWLLTLDKAAREIGGLLSSRRISSPIMDPEFLAQLLQFRPGTPDAAKEKISGAPLMLGLTRSNAIPTEMIEAIEEIRGSMPGISPRRMRRSIRDEMNRRKTVAAADFTAVTEPITRRE